MSLFLSSLRGFFFLKPTVGETKEQLSQRVCGAVLAFQHCVCQWTVNTMYSARFIMCRDKYPRRCEILSKLCGCNSETESCVVGSNSPVCSLLSIASLFCFDLGKIFDILIEHYHRT